LYRGYTRQFANYVLKRRKWDLESIIYFNYNGGIDYIYFYPGRWTMCNEHNDADHNKCIDNAYVYAVRSLLSE
jgi:hypothetical protein